MRCTVETTQYSMMHIEIDQRKIIPTVYTRNRHKTGPKNKQQEETKIFKMRKQFSHPELNKKLHSLLIKLRRKKIREDNGRYINGYRLKCIGDGDDQYSLPTIVLPGLYQVQ